MKRMKYTLKITAPGGDVTEAKMPAAGLAFAAARGIIRDTHFDVEIQGVYGVAKFNNDGSGTITWNANSTCPAGVTVFGARTTVMI